jgi:hypothetical protein
MTDKSLSAFCLITAIPKSDQKFFSQISLYMSASGSDLLLPYHRKYGSYALWN